MSLPITYVRWGIAFDEIVVSMVYCITGLRYPAYKNVCHKAYQGNCLLFSTQGLTEEQLGLVNDLFEWLVDPCLTFIRKSCRTFIQTSEMHLVQSLMHLYTCLMDEIIHTLEQKPSEGDEPQHDQGLTNQQVGVAVNVYTVFLWL